MPPLLSIELTTYNRLEGLKRAINSVLSQSMTAWELIISDDGSEHIGIFEYLDGLSKTDNRVQVFYQNENIGVKHNYLFVYHQARGDYFTWLSDDDHYNSPDHLRLMMEKIKVGYDLVFPDIKKIRKEKNGYRTLNDRNMSLSVNKRFISHLLLITKGYLGYQVMFGVFKKNKLDEALPYFINQTHPDEGAMTHYCLASYRWCSVDIVLHVKDMTDAHLYRLSYKKVLSYLYPHSVSVINVLLSSLKYSYFQRVMLSCLYVCRIIYIALHVLYTKHRFNHRADYSGCQTTTCDNKDLEKTRFWR
jgi:glycosyltransferase involved in cell wall biosynthesis